MGSNTICAGSGAGIAEPETYHIGSSPVHSFLVSNLPPSTDDQMNVTLKTLLELQKDLVDLDESISYMRVALQRLLSKRSALREYADAHKGLVSPLRRLPREILSEIFYHTLPAFPFKLFKDQSPLVLEHVCKQWWDVSRSTPALWSHISLDLSKSNVSRHIQYAATCLARSGECPLSISLGSGHRSHSVPSQHPVLAMLTSHSECWHTLHLKLPSELIRELSVVKGRLPMLRDLHIFVLDSDWNDHIPPFDAFASAPKLRHFNASSKMLRDIAINGAIVISWKDLTSLVLDERGCGDIWRILQYCTRLVEIEATFSINAGTEDYTLRLPQLKLMHLRSLSLSLPESSSSLSTLTLPALEQAAFRFTTEFQGALDRSQFWHVRSGFDVLLSQSSCTLLKLSLHDKGNILTHGDLFGCLEAVPSLIELDLSANLSIQLLRGLEDRKSTETAAHETFLPRLRKMALFQPPDHLSWELLWEFLKSRREGEDHIEMLQSLKLTSGNHGWAECTQTRNLDRLRTLRAKGMDVEIVDRGGNVRWL